MDVSIDRESIQALLAEDTGAWAEFRSDGTIVWPEYLVVDSTFSDLGDGTEAAGHHADGQDDADDDGEVGQSGEALRDALAGVETFDVAAMAQTSLLYGITEFVRIDAVAVVGAVVVQDVEEQRVTLTPAETE